MSRRRRRDWSASGLPRLRDAWTRALSSELGRQGRDIDVARAHGDQAPAEVREAVRVYDATLPAREALIEHTSRAELYWVTAPMVDLATESALSLPAWTPTTAVPCDAGLLCWQRPATTHLPHPDGGTCTWDAVLWCPNPVADHALLLQALTRTPGGDLPLTPGCRGARAARRDPTAEPRRRWRAGDFGARGGVASDGPTGGYRVDSGRARGRGVR